MPDDETMQAVMYGPLVLAGRFDAVGKDQTYGTYGPRGSQAKVPEIVAKSADAASCIEPNPRQPLAFQAVGPSPSRSRWSLSTR